MNLKPRAQAPLYAAACALLAAATLVAGCVYRPDIQQGNLLEVKDVDQVTAGMTRSQVRYLLGTPMISDPFTAQRWDYIYTLKRGRSRRIDRSHFVVYFNGDTVDRVEKLDVPEAPPKATPEDEKALRKQAEDASREPPAAPPPEQPSPDSPRPGDGQGSG